MTMDFGDYVTEKVAAARLGELREHCARATLLSQARGDRRGLISPPGIALTRLRRGPAPGPHPGPEGRGRAPPGGEEGFPPPQGGGRATGRRPTRSRGEDP